MGSQLKSSDVQEGSAGLASHSIKERSLVRYLEPQRVAACTDAWLEESLPRKPRGLGDVTDFLPCFVSELCGVPGQQESAGVMVLGWERVSLLFADVP